MLKRKNYSFWFCAGSQDLYGDECLEHVAAHSKRMVEGLNESGVLPYKVIWKPTLLTNEQIRRTLNEANLDEECAGVITWMHTFSPAKSWILGLREYRKPLLHLHTQFNEEIPYDTIDMDFMNENQSAHGGREYGHIVTRMGIERKVIAGYWQDEEVQKRIASWMRTAVGIVESSRIRIMRVSDNMRNVAVTEGDKVEAQLKFGWEIDTYPVNEIAECVDSVSEADTRMLVDEYYETYDILLDGRDPEEFRRHAAVQAQIELFSGGKGLSGHCNSFWRSGFIKAAAGTGDSETDAEGLWLWSGGRLEGGRNGSFDEAYDRGYEGRKGHVHAGGLHLQFRKRKGRDSAGSYAGGLPHHGRGIGQHPLPAPVYGRQGRSGKTGIYL